MKRREHVVDPRMVTAPKTRWQLIDVLVETDDWTMALGRWKDEEWQPRLALRWNGSRLSPKGNPSSHGEPTWFILPPDLNAHVLQVVNGDKRFHTEDVLDPRRPLARDLRVSAAHSGGASLEPKKQKVRHKQIEALICQVEKATARDLEATLSELRKLGVYVQDQALISDAIIALDRGWIAGVSDS